MTEAPPAWTEGGRGLVGHACSNCGNRWYFRRVFCPNCGSCAVSATASAGLGTVYAVTRVDRAPSPEWRDLAPYGIALIDLDGGVRAMTQADPALQIGDRVRISFRTAPTGTIPFAETGA